ncbi:MAG: salt stress protein, Slr1339 family [Synechocystis sp.]
MADSDSLESILADMRQKYVEGSEQTSKSLVGDSPLDQKKQQHPSLDKLLNELKQDLKTNQLPSQADQIQPVKQETKRPLDPEINHLVAQQKKHNQEIIRQKAQRWLDELDQLSGEGIWFADFAKHYPSPLAAAMDLLANGSV